MEQFKRKVDIPTSSRYLMLYLFVYEVTFN
jgi:hypothetical protein